MSMDDKDINTAAPETAESDFFSEDPMARYSEKKKSRGTKGKIIAIICGAALIAALAGGAAAVSIAGIGSGEEETAESTENTGAYTFMQGRALGDASSIVIENPDGTGFEVYKSKEAEGEEEPEFSIKGYEDYALDTSMIRTLPSNILGLITEDTVAENADDLEKYGLGETAVKVRVELEDGESGAFRVGNVCADSSYTYFCIEGEKTVYTVQSSKLTNYMKTADSFISKTILSALDEESGVYVKKVDISRKDIDYDIVLEYDRELAEENDKAEDETDSASSADSTTDLKMIQPVECALNASKAEDTIEGMFGMSASEIIKLSPDSEDMKEYKLDDPQCKTTVKTSDGKAYTLKIGDSYKNEESDTVYCYVYLEGGEDIVYGVMKDSLTWLTLQPLDITSKILIKGYVWDVASLKVEAAGHDTLQFLGSGSSKSDYVVTKNGKECDSERYRAFYAFLIKAYAEEIVTDKNVKAEGDPLLCVEYSMQDGTKGSRIEFYDAGGLKALITVDGKPYFKCRKSFVDAVINNIDIFDTDEEFASSWE